MTPDEYRDLLDEGWRLHEQPRAEDAPTVISTFAGCGGSSLGYSMAGFRELLAVEWEKHAASMFRLNFPEVPVYEGDIAKLSDDHVLELAGIAPGELDVFDGSPPCQGFSTAGRRQMDDPRNQLFREFVRLLTVLQPRTFVMENVSGMVKGNMRLVFAEALRALKGAGYRVRVELFDASWFNVPQARQRLIFIGVREDLGVEPSHPKPLAHRLAVVDAVPTIQATIIATRSMNIMALVEPVPESDLPPGQPALDDRYGRLWPLVPIGKSAATVTGAKCGPEGKTPAGWMSCYKLDPSKPSPTLSKTQTGRGFATLVHPYEMRALSIDEAKIIGSFPRAFTLQGSYSDQWARIGNSVPPFMMRAIAEHLRDVILPATRKAPAEAGA